MTPSLEELSSRWLLPEREEDFCLPALTGPQGAVQAAWGPTGIQNWVRPPTGLATATAALFYREGDRLQQFPDNVLYQWRAYEVLRRGHGVESTLRLPARGDAVIERVRFERPGRYYLVFGGLPRTFRFADLDSLPPAELTMPAVRAGEGGFWIEDSRTFGRVRFGVDGELGVYRDLPSWLAGRAPAESGTLGVAAIEAAAGQEVVWWAAQGCEEELPAVDLERDWNSGKEAWEELWRAAFEPGNGHFSGSLPGAPAAVVEAGLQRLYAMSVLSLLQCRRAAPTPTERSRLAAGASGASNGAARGAAPPWTYVGGGAEGGATSLLARELELQAPLLARLDPEALRGSLEAMLAIDLGRHGGFDGTAGAGVGPARAGGPGALLSAAADYVRLTGDRGWALDRLEALERCARPELTDYGDSRDLFECIPAYEHAVASLNAQAVQGLRFLATLTGDRRWSRAARGLASRVLELYADGPFACLQPDGSRRVVGTVLDFAYVGGAMTEDVPPFVRRGMLDWFDRELCTESWLRALPEADAAEGLAELPPFQRLRADQRAAGCHVGWAALCASVMLRFGERGKALEWLRRVQEHTLEGPFGQAHALADGGARKAGPCRAGTPFGAAGGAFAGVLLEDL